MRILLTTLAELLLGLALVGLLFAIGEEHFPSPPSCVKIAGALDIYCQRK